MNFPPKNKNCCKGYDGQKIYYIGKEQIKLSVNNKYDYNKYEGSNDPDHLLSISLADIKYASMLFIIDCCINIQPSQEYQYEVDQDRQPVYIFYDTSAI